MTIGKILLTAAAAAVLAAGVIGCAAPPALLPGTADGPAIQWSDYQCGRHDFHLYGPNADRITITSAEEAVTATLPDGVTYWYCVNTDDLTAMKGADRLYQKTGNLAEWERQVSELDWADWIYVAY